MNTAKIWVTSLKCLLRVIRDDNGPKNNSTNDKNSKTQLLRFHCIWIIRVKVLLYEPSLQQDFLIYYFLPLIEMLRNSSVYVLNEWSLMPGEKKSINYLLDNSIIFLISRRCLPIFKQIVYLIKHYTMQW